MSTICDVKAVPYGVALKLSRRIQAWEGLLEPGLELRWGSRLLEGFVQEINRFTMAGGREESRTVKLIVFSSRGIQTWTGGADSRIPELFWYINGTNGPSDPIPEQQFGH